MKKTLIISLEFPPQIGGIATYVHSMAEVLDPKRVIVLAPPFEGDKEWDKQQKYKIIRKKLLFPKFIWPRWLKLVWIVFGIVKKEKIELVLIHHVLPVGYAGILIKKLKKIPFLLFSHGTDLLAGTASAWKKKMVTKVSEHAEQVIFNSESLQRRFLEVLPQFANKALVVYPCPDPDLLVEPSKEDIEKLREHYALQGKEVMLTVSRICDGKGFPHLIRMMPKILEKAPHLVWVIVGGGHKKDFILKEIQRLNLQNVVRFIGEIPHNDLKEYYYLADLFVLLTHPDEGREEGLGLVFLEASAAGLPIVAGKSGGVEEAVIHTQTGVVVDIFKGDPAVIEAISEMLRNKRYAMQLGKQAKERIKTHFRWEHQIDRLKPWLEV
jgi:phosphatidyl-myo-inositol dimannoside synthase